MRTVISFMMAVSSKIVVDSIVAGAGLGMSIYKTAKGIRQGSRGSSRRRRYK